MTRTVVAAALVAAAACGPKPPSTAPPPAPTATPAPSFETSLMTAQAGSAVRGMTPVGGVVGAQLEEGQVGEHPLDLEPGRCYAVVAGGLPDIVELELEIVVAASPSAAPTRLARDDSLGSLAIAGAPDGCVLGTGDRRTATIVVKAARGHGAVALQVYAK